MTLSAETVQHIKDASSLLSVVGESVSLRKSGPRYVGLCPFHAEKTPSFSVSDEKGLYYCFGCHAGGDVLSFVMKHQGVDFQSAVSFLALRAGIVLENAPPEEQLKRAKEKHLVEINTWAWEFFTQALVQPYAQAARAYLRERGVNRADVKTWGIGFGGEEGACLAALKAKGCSTDDLFEAGLLSENRERCLFDKRIVFPVHDALGRLAGFGGRKIQQDGPKYINTRESLLFSKRQLLYGWKQSEPSIRTRQQVLIVEGYLDVIAAHRSGITHTVAALGTAFTAQHAALCHRLAKEATLLLDSDAAGTRGTTESTIKLLQQGFKVKTATLPSGEDPDSWVRKAGPQALQQAVAQALPSLEHAITQAFAKPSMGIDEKVEAARTLQPFLSALPQSLERDLYTAQLAQKVGVSQEQLKKHLKLTQTPPPKTTHTTPTNPAPKNNTPPKSLLQKAEIDLIREIFVFPELKEKCGLIAEYALNEPLRVFLDDFSKQDAPLPVLIEQHFKDDPPTLQTLLKYCSEKTVALPEADRQSKAQHVFDTVVQKLKWKHIDMALQDVLRELHETEARGEATDELLRRKQELTNRKRVLKEKTNQ